MVEVKNTLFFAGGFLCCAAVFVGGLLLGYSGGRIMYEKDAVNAGVARYHPQTAGFEFLDYRVDENIAIDATKLTFGDQDAD